MVCKVIMAREPRTVILCRGHEGLCLGHQLPSLKRCYLAEQIVQLGMKHQFDAKDCLTFSLPNQIIWFILTYMMPILKKHRKPLENSSLASCFHLSSLKLKIWWCSQCLFQGLSLFCMVKTELLLSLTTSVKFFRLVL